MCWRMASLPGKAPPAAPSRQWYTWITLCELLAVCVVSCLQLAWAAQLQKVFGWIPLAVQTPAWEV